MKKSIIGTVLIALLLLFAIGVSAGGKGATKYYNVCWQRDGTQWTGTFLVTGSGIVHQWNTYDYGSAYLYKPASKFDMSGEPGWTWYSTPAVIGFGVTACDGSVSIYDILTDEAGYWLAQVA